jgi:hypothetical protein
MKIEEVFDALANAGLDAEVIEVFHESGDIWVKISNVDMGEDDE